MGKTLLNYLSIQSKIFVLKCIRKKIERRVIFQTANDIPIDFELERKDISKYLYYVYSTKEIKEKDNIYGYLFAYDMEKNDKNFHSVCFDILKWFLLYSILFILFFPFVFKISAIGMLMVGVAFVAINYWLVNNVLGILSSWSMENIDISIYDGKKRILYGSYKPEITDYQTFLSAYLFLILTFSFYVGSLLKA